MFGCCWPALPGGLCAAATALTNSAEAEPNKILRHICFVIINISSLLGFRKDGVLRRSIHTETSNDMTEPRIQHQRPFSVLKSDTDGGTLPRTPAE
jgi:hypothetical protein